MEISSEYGSFSQTISANNARKNKGLLARIEITVVHSGAVLKALGSLRSTTRGKLHDAVSINMNEKKLFGV